MYKIYEHINIIKTVKIVETVEIVEIVEILKILKKLKVVSNTRKGGDNMKTYKIVSELRLLIILTLLIFIAPYGNMPVAAESDQLKECYSQCLNLYSEYMAAVKNNLDAASIDARFQSYKSALDK